MAIRDRASISAISPSAICIALLGALVAAVFGFAIGVGAQMAEIAITSIIQLDDKHAEIRVITKQLKAAHDGLLRRIEMLEGQR